jgi:O-antigen/teichoic acid export membrane protein
VTANGSRPWASHVGSASAALVGQLSYRACTAILLLVAAHSLSLGQFGALSLGVALAAVVQAVTLYGFDTHLLRGLAAGDRAPVDATPLLRTKMLLAVIAFLVAVSLFPFLDDQAVLWVVLALPLCGVLAALAETPETVLAASGRYAMRGFIQGAPAIISLVAVLVLAVTSRGEGPELFAGAMAAREGLRLLGGVAVTRIVPRPASRAAHLKQARQHLVTAWPFAAVSVLGYLYFRLDVLLLSRLEGSSTVAYYAAAYIFLTGMSGVLAALSPLILTTLTANPGLYERYRTLAAATGLLATVLTVLAGPHLVPPLFGEGYEPARPLVLILAFVFPFTFVNSLALRAIYARQLERTVPRALLVATSVNVVGNLLLIPPHGAAACAAMTVATEALLSVLFGAVLRKADRAGGTRRTGVPANQHGIDAPVPDQTGGAT